MKSFFAILAVMLILGCVFFVFRTHLSFPHEMKLADCTNGVVNIRLNVPKGHNFALLLNVPGSVGMTNGSLVSSYKFTGHIRIKSRNSLIIDIPINSDKMSPISSGFILTGGGFQPNIPSLNQLIQTQKEYDLEIEFNPPPPPSSSISLYWKENAAEKAR
jgi:hypothetical protein